MKNRRSKLEITDACVIESDRREKIQGLNKLRMENQLRGSDGKSGNGVELESTNGSRVVNALPPPPPIIPPILEPVWVKTKVVEKKNLRVPMARLGFGSKNQKIPLLTNHFKVNVANLQEYFYQYSVLALFYYDGRRVEKKGVGRKVDKVDKNLMIEVKDFIVQGGDGNKSTDESLDVEDDKTTDEEAGLDQTRGWFYTLMVLSTALFGKPAFRNLICNGLVLAEDGKKMSKSEKNYPPPLEVIDEYGADAVRLYLINSPVVRAEPLRFRKEGVLGVVKDVFLPWYNAYRFLVQNAKRLEVEGSGPFVPTDLATLRSSNVLDQWIHSATQSLVCFVRLGDGCLSALYRKLLTCLFQHEVVPYLLKFLDNLTNIYVRFNRKRLKGRTGEDDCHIALSTLYNVLLTSCKVMTPFTPFFTETLYQNLRKAREGSDESIHYCSFPEADGTRVERRIEQSVTRMMTVIDLARNIRERHKLPLKTPLMEITVVHPDAELLDDITGKLREIVRVFKRPDGLKDTEIDANGDGDVLVLLDLRPDDSLYEAGVAREIVNRVQKLRKKSGLEPTDVVEVYIDSLDKDESALQQVLSSQEQYIKDTIGSSLLPSRLMPSHAVILSDESFQNVSKLSFKISLARPACVQITVSCVEKLPVVNVVLGDQLMRFQSLCHTIHL
ncbi:hypothetical protein F2Q69_00057198 [Brassica cretica]|uniref:Isoleucyl-tRNA synthetase n=1 Tax=Brassica cretica TaxID=69181 RepID=A0A8S9N1X0_BRACR|nr:hypothetical protein F2Q69_00057198 [Brassica cretica]